MKKHFLSLIALLIAVQTAFWAQNGWQQLLPSNTGLVARDIIPTADGHFWVLANLKKFVQSTESWDIHLLKMSAEGVFLDTVVVTQAYGMTLQSLPDGSFTILGRQWSSAWYDGKVLVVKLDAAGQLQWQTVLVRGDAYTMIPDGSGGYYVGGWYDGAPKQSFLYRLDASGDALWSKYYPISNRSAVQAIHRLDNQNLLLIGRTATVGVGLYGIFMLKVKASDGEMVWQKRQDVGRFRFDPFPHDFPPMGVVKDTDGNIVVACPGDPNASPGSGIFRFNTNGDLLQTIPLTSFTYRRAPMDIVLDDEGNYIIAGGADFYTNELQPLIEKRNSNGEVLWSHRLPGLGQIAGLVRGPDGSFLACGVDQGYAASSNIFQSQLFRFDSTGNSFPCRIEGYVRADADFNCKTEPNELPSPLWNLLLDGHTLLKTDQEGYYRADVLPGEHQIRLLAPEPLYSACVPDSNLTVTLDSPTVSLNFAVQKGADCPLLEVGITQTDFVLCDTNQIYVSWQNRGNTAANNVRVRVFLDPYLTLVEASEPYDLDSDALIFTIGTVAKDASGTIRLAVRLDCDAPRFATHCVEAHIEPISFCSAPPDILWNGAQVKVQGNCVGSNAQFLLYNANSAAMSTPRSYRIYGDGALLKTESFVLGAEQSLAVEWPANGRTITLRAEQEASFPFSSNPVASVEGCGTPDGIFPSNSFATIFPLNDAEPWVSKVCAENTARVTGDRIFEIPKGFGHYHWMVDDSADCEFSLRVTNPTSQTVETLSLALTPSLEFNLATFEPVAWSHPYNVEFRHSGEIFVQSQGIGLPPGADFCFRFRLKMHPKPGYAFASIAGQAYFDNQGPFDLYEAFYNVASENVFLSNEATPASTDVDVRLFGRGNSWDFVSDLAQTPNGDVYTSGVILNNGEGRDLLVVRSDSTGKGIWQKTYKLGPGNIYPTAMQSLLDGSVMVAGALEDVTKEDYLNYSYAFVAHILADGTLDWLRQWKPNMGGSVYDIELAPDGNAIIWGLSYQGNGSWKNFMHKITPENAVIWEKTYSSSFFGGRLKSGADGFLYFFAQSDDTTYHIARFNYNGELVASSWPTYNYIISIRDFAPTVDGSIILAGTDYEWDAAAQVSKYFLIQVKLNNQFQTIWTRRTLYGSYLDVTSVEASGQAYFVSGSIAQNGDYDALLVKTDLNGTPLLNRTFPANAREFGQRLFVGQNHRIWMVAQTQTVDYFYNLQMMLISLVDPDALVSLNEFEENAQLKACLFPNPSTGETWLEFNVNKAKSITVTITDQTGRIIWEAVLNNAHLGLNKFNLPELHSGVFIVTIQSDTTVLMEKLIRLEKP